MSTIPEGDLKLLGYIEDAKPSTFDKALNLYAELAEQHRSSLEAIARKLTWIDANSEDVVSDTILKGYLTIYFQLGGSEEVLPQDLPVKAAKSFTFERKHGITLKSWLVQLMKGAKGGVLRTHNRRAKTHSDRHESIPERETLAFADSEQTDVESAIDALSTGDHIDKLEAAISSLPARQRFIVTTRYGIGFDEPITAVFLSEFAKSIGLEDAAKVASRSKRMGVDNDTAKLQMQEIATVLDLSTKQVKRDLTGAIEALNKSLTKAEAA